MDIKDVYYQQKVKGKEFARRLFVRNVCLLLVLSFESHSLPHSRTCHGLTDL